VSCPCGKGETLETCCGPLLAGKALPETAEALMRARYTAYTQGNVDYIVDTHDPDRRGEVDRRNTEAWSKQSEWLGLEILSTDKGGPEDEVGVVEFVARYKLKGVKIDHRERALFRKNGTRWVFVDGAELKGPPVVRTEPKIGRNDPCHCGSGKKFKKCHGAEA
jgi:SEC-C motif-containing protein